MPARHTKIFLWTLTVLLSLAAGLWLVAVIGENPRLALPHTALLRSQNVAWKTKLEQLSLELDRYEYILEDIEERDNVVYRQMFGLKEVPTSDPNVESYLSDRIEGLEAVQGSELESAVARMDALSGRVALRSEALSEITAYTSLASGMATAIPSIPPLLPSDKVRLSSSFGYRTDPVYGGRRRHLGQDFAVDRGYPVYATGDAIVEEANTQYHGYGNVVLLDHGYGYKTRYAHLSKMLVSQGDTVSRGQLVGLVGNTGKSTGPHLHYEVFYRGENVNPMSYMDYSMEEKDYKELTEQK